jgi:mRNA-degrading endonuclease toxin of MazEF toxin-antitoxin module
MIEPGSIYTADFEDAGPHPVIVVSRLVLNRGRYAVVVVCTSARFQQRHLLPELDPHGAADGKQRPALVRSCLPVLYDGVRRRFPKDASSAAAGS